MRLRTLLSDSYLNSPLSLTSAYTSPPAQAVDDSTRETTNILVFGAFRFNRRRRKRVFPYHRMSPCLGFSIRQQLVSASANFHQPRSDRFRRSCWIARNSRLWHLEVEKAQKLY